MNNSNNNPFSDESGQANLVQGKAWLTDFRQRFIAAQKWTEKEAKLRIRDCWAIIRDERVQVLEDGDQRPADAVPVFQFLTPGGWKVPLRVQEQLTGLVERALTSERSPRDILLGLLSHIERADGEDESKEIKQKRHIAVFWATQMLNGCENKALSDVIKTDAFWQVLLSSFHAGYRLLLLELHRNPQLLTDLIKAQAFGSGRSPDELTKRLEASFLELGAEHGRPPKLKEVAKAAGGRWSDMDACWEFNGLAGKPSISHGALRDRLKDIRQKHSQLF